MKKYALGLLLVIYGMTGFVSTAGAELQSLRGDSLIEQKSMTPEIKPYFRDREPMIRDYLQQPPLIPHKTDSYRINVKHNKCLSCHSWQNYRKHNATKISQTHFESRGGAVLSNVSARRYFCTQCHVPQVDAVPLIGNTFQPVDIMKVH